MNTFINNIYTIIAIPVVLTAVITFIYMHKLQTSTKLSFLVGDDKWTFIDWANPLTSVTAGLGLIITIAQNSPTITGLSLICGQPSSSFPPRTTPCVDQKVPPGLFSSFLHLCSGLQLSNWWLPRGLQTTIRWQVYPLVPCMHSASSCV